MKYRNPKECSFLQECSFSLLKCLRIPYPNLVLGTVKVHFDDAPGTSFNVQS